MAVLPELAPASPLLPRHRSARLSTDGTAAVRPRLPARLSTAPGARGHPTPITHLLQDAVHGGHEALVAAPQPLLHRLIPLHGEGRFCRRAPPARHCAAGRSRPDSNRGPPPLSPPSIGSCSNQFWRCSQSKCMVGGLCSLIGCWLCRVPDHPASKSWLWAPSQEGLGSLFHLVTAAGRGSSLAAGPAAAAGRGLPLAAAHGATWAQVPRPRQDAPPGGRRRLGALSGLGSSWQGFTERCVSVGFGTDNRRSRGWGVWCSVAGSRALPGPSPAGPLRLRAGGLWGGVELAKFPSSQSSQTLPTHWH